MAKRSHRRQRRRADQPDSTFVELSTRLALDLAGCTCDPDVELVHEADGWHQKISHDDWCPAIQAASVTVVRPAGRHRDGS